MAGLWFTNGGSAGFKKILRGQMNAQDDVGDENADLFGGGQEDAYFGVCRKMQVLKIFAHEDIFGEGSPTFFREVISVARIMFGWQQYGRWFEQQEKAITGRKLTQDEVQERELVRIGTWDGTHVQLVSGVLYFQFQEQAREERRLEAKMMNDDDTEDAKACFQRIGERVAATLKEKKQIVIALAGMCGCGKSTRLPRVIHEHTPHTTIFVVEARRGVAVKNAY